MTEHVVDDPTNVGLQRMIVMVKFLEPTCYTL